MHEKYDYCGPVIGEPEASTNTSEPVIAVTPQAALHGRDGKAVALPRYITTARAGSSDVLLVAIPVDGRRALTKTLRRRPDESDEDLVGRAVRWRDRAWRRIHGGPVPARSFHTHARADSATGTPGVREILKRVDRRGGPVLVAYIIAEVHTQPGLNYLRPQGSRSRLYSLEHFDRDEAIALAAAWRATQIAKLERG